MPTYLSSPADLRRPLLATAFLMGVVGLYGACGGGDEPCSVEEQTGCGEGQACYAVEGGEPACFCSVDTQTGCDNGLACELVPGNGAGCFAPVTVGGTVFDLIDGSPVGGAHVVARDTNNAAISGVAITESDGTYVLQVPAPRADDGSLLSSEFTLRADALGYATFPGWPRVAIPVDISNATGDPPHLEASSTDIALLPIDASGLGTISGTVHATRPRGTLVVAGGATGVADFDGTYTVFNVPAGTVTVSGYKFNQQLDSVSADVVAGQTTSGVDLNETGEAIAIVSGKVEIVNPGAGSDTSVILVVQDTFNPEIATGEAPPGLRIGEVSGDWQIAGVPDGTYAVLAAFENDFLVRDPDTSIAGTEVVIITVAGADVILEQSFKITGSLDVVSPDAEEIVSGTPTFVWVDDSGEDHYEVALYDAFGTKVWEKLDVPGVSGDPNVTVQYGGNPLVPGLIYQFRATSIKLSGSPLARTEDLRGVFLYQGP